RQGFETLRVIDFDRVEERNLSTQPYGRADIGRSKVGVLSSVIYRSVGVDLDAVARRIEDSNSRRLLRGVDLVVDCLDNHEARSIVTARAERDELECLHVGLDEDYGEIIWNERYRVPGDPTNDVCDEPLSRNLVVLTATLAAEAILRFATLGEKRDRSITMRDLSIDSLELQSVR
ncbi:MAG: ThiF family adenylyltransferase, partial [Planctomycetota bacterium]